MQKPLLLLVILINLISCTQDEEKRSDSIHAIPIDAAIIIESNNISNSINELKESPFWITLSKETSLKETQESLFTFDSTIATYASHISSKNPVFLSLHLTGAKSFNWLLVSSTEYQEQKIQLLEIGLASFTKTQNHPYSNTFITEVAIDQSSFFYAKHNGLVMLSAEKILIEDAIRQLKTPNNLTAQNDFKEIYDSANKKEDFNIYLNTKNFDRISNSIFAENTKLNSQAEWMQWDLYFKSNGLLFSGISLSYDSLAQELSLLNGNDAHAVIAPSVLPKNTALFVSKSFENFKQLQRKQLNALDVKHQKNTYTKNLEGLNEDLKTNFESWIDSEITWFLAENSSNLAEGLIIHVTNETEIGAFISQKTDSIILYREEVIFNWTEFKFLSTLTTTSFTKDLKYGCIIDEQLVLSGELSLVKSIINDFKAEKSLKNNADYQNCMNELNSRSNLFVYLQNPSALQLAPKYLQTVLANFTSVYADALNPFRALAIQFELSNSICYSNAYLHFDKSEADQTRALWTTQLKAPLLSEISLVKNHYNQQWELAVQDTDFNFYLISTQGEILWDRKLNSKIIGEIKQIDLFKNKKLQMLFNTTDKLYLIDRKGRDVKSYPIVLDRKTELPLALFDYQNQRNYRILLSCGKHHFMYNKYGKKIKGWELSKTKSKAVHSAQHFVVAGKDYILLPEENGTLNILSRKGKSRIKVKGKIDFSDNKLHVVKGFTLAETRIVTVDKHGNQQNILFDGSIDNSIQFEFDEGIYYAYKLAHHIGIESEDLQVNGEIMNLKYSFDNEVLSTPKTSVINQQFYLSVTDLKSEKAYLFRSPNELVEGFPLYGKTTGILKDIDLDNKLNFIVGGESGMLYNYSAE
jgi:hypothetical protein